ncbi:hypothetical protein [Pseudomonas proteolytica]|mgnify:FL=1|uniref:hypothetical protein n=1 Tax=Pseudomonas proteolytica TaxID=219574 RepID=UPI00089D3FD0|nr:hypothetical protein [Pseudomonas proteolytica]KAA8698646.1 hypothetical protein F4W61_23900 [Pseudomonas proteolytica]TWR69361.1 hypothetical protein FIV38_29700 [Pseudomonas proteolytica]SEE79300.1 hypothetical protein SAMN04490200_5462 [Pseudomonas proteolytica]
MSEVQRYYVGKYGLVEGQALGRLSVVLAADFDKANRLFLDAAERCIASERREKELQALLTAADERADVLEGLLREVLIELPFYRYRFRIQAVLEPLEASLEGPHLILDMCGIPIPASDFMKALGITYQLAVPQSMTDTWWFFNCDNMSDATPSRLRVLDRTAQQCVGWGLSQQMADEIKAWRKLPLKPVNLSVSIKPAEGGGDELV